MIEHLRPIDRYEAPQWLIRERATLAPEDERAEIEAVEDAGYEVIERGLLGWGPYEIVVRCGDNDYLARVSA